MYQWRACYGKRDELFVPLLLLTVHGLASAGQECSEQDKSTQNLLIVAMQQEFFRVTIAPLARPVDHNDVQEEEEEEGPMWPTVLEQHKVAYRFAATTSMDCFQRSANH